MNKQQIREIRVEDWIERAKKVGEIAEPESIEADRNARFSDRVAQAIKDTELQKLMRPKRYGGYSGTPRLFAKVIRTTGRYNLAAGWLVYFYPMHEVWVAYLHPEGRKEIFDQGGLVADVIAPLGKAERDGDGWRVYGQWNFASGIPWSDWIGLGCIAELPGGQGPEPCLFAAPVSELRIVENWDTLGLRATASHRVEADGVWVPDRRILPYRHLYEVGKPIGGEWDEDEPIYRVPFMPLFGYGFVPIALAGAERLLEIYRERTEKRIRAYEGGSKDVEKREKQRLLGALQSQLEAADALFDRYIDQLEAWVQEGRSVITDAERNRMYAWRAQVIEMCADIARKVLALGGTSLYRGDPVELIVRDILMLSAHGAHLYEDAVTFYGATMFGLPGHPVW